MRAAVAGKCAIFVEITEQLSVARVASVILLESPAAIILVNWKTVKKRLYSLRHQVFKSHKRTARALCIYLGVAFSPRVLKRFSLSPAHSEIIGD